MLVQGVECRVDFVNQSQKLLFQNYHQAHKETKFHGFQPCIIVVLGTLGFQMNI